MYLENRQQKNLKEDIEERKKMQKPKRRTEVSGRPRTKKTERHATLCMPTTGKEKKSAGRMPWH